MSTKNDLKEITEELKNYLEFRQSMGVKSVPKSNMPSDNSPPTSTEKKERRIKPMEKDQKPICS